MYNKELAAGNPAPEEALYTMIPVHPAMLFSGTPHIDPIRHNGPNGGSKWPIWPYRGARVEGI